MGERHVAGRTDCWGVETHELIVIAGVAVAAGIAIHLVLHVARLHWTWGLALTLLAAPHAVIDRPVAAMWLASTVIATATSREWHQRDLERGGTEAQRTRGRIGVGSAISPPAWSRRSDR